MDIARIAEEIAASYLRQLDPTEGIAEEVAEENDDGKPWAVLLRPGGTWTYILVYVSGEGWSLVRLKQGITGMPSAENGDIQSLGVYPTKLHATAIALTLMEDQG